MSGCRHNQNCIQIAVAVDPCNYPNLVTKRLHRHYGAHDPHFITGSYRWPALRTVQSSCDLYNFFVIR
jgi:hypothetical protein